MCSGSLVGCVQYVLCSECCSVLQVGSSVFWSAAGTALCWAGTWCRERRRLLPTSSPSHSHCRTSRSMFYTARFIIRLNSGEYRKIFAAKISFVILFFIKNILGCSSRTVFGMPYLSETSVDVSSPSFCYFHFRTSVTLPFRFMLCLV